MNMELSDLNMFLILVSSLFVNNIILTKFLGLCPFFGISKRLSSSAGMGLAVIFVMLLSSSATWLIYHFILIPFNLLFLRTATFILVIATLVQLLEIFLRRFIPPLYKSLGIYLPLITTNCAILGTAFLVVNYQLSFLQMIFYALGTSSGFFLVIFLFAGIRERISIAPIPEIFKEVPIAFLTAGLLSLAFMGFKGLFGL